MSLPASISLDLDNLWSYLKTQGAPGWESFPSYLEVVVPRILETLDRCQQRVTFFIVGKDATIESNRGALKQIAEAGHEIASHSFMHEPWLHLYSREQLHSELEGAENAIAALTGRKPRGFRGPGFSTSPLVREVLAERGYQYDASLCPSALGPVARMFFLLNSKLSAEEKAKRKGLYGRFSDAFGPLKPFTWDSGLTEIPVTTMPLLRLPVHATYLMFLAEKSEALAKAYWSTNILLSRLREVPPSMLLHPTDFLDVTDVPEMGFFPGMRLHASKKCQIVEHAIRALQRHWSVRPMGNVAALLREPSLSLALSAQPA